MYFLIILLIDFILEMEISPEEITTWPGKVFSVTCTAIPRVDGTRLPRNITLEWKRIAVSPTGIESESILKNSTHRNTHEAVSTLTITESDSVSNITYVCTAGEPKISNISYIDISVVEGIIKLKIIYLK